jgi:Amt family ammonium transporter
MVYLKGGQRMTRKVFIIMFLAFLIAGLAAPIVLADGDAPTIASNAQAIESRSIALDTVWVLIAAILVMFMQAGFALLEAGFTRSKNAVNILMKNLMDFSFGTITYYMVGFALMFGAGNLFFGTSGFFLHDAGNTFASLDWSTVPLELKFFFQLVFAATAATIVSGAMAERTRFVAYLFYSIVISAVIYPIVGHWIWGGGWLAELGMWDFAGSTVVHSTGGWLAQMSSRGTACLWLLWAFSFFGLAGSVSTPAAPWVQSLILLTLPPPPTWQQRQER